MKQIVFVSGKGGTGKSTLVASLTRLIPDKRFADCDVDAPNLHLLTGAKSHHPQKYYGSKKATIDSKRCTQCGLCIQVCRFAAIRPDHTVDRMICEGCAACTVVCPVHAIRLSDALTGFTDRQVTRYGMFSNARLEAGADGSGKLVTQVRRSVLACSPSEEYVLIDGSPGIGCVVIASITGTDAVVVVAEPTQTGLHDMARILDTADHFRIPSFVCINKFDLDEPICQSLEVTCKARNVPIVAKIPFDPNVMKALQQNKTPVEAGLDEYIVSVTVMWQKIIKEIKDHDKESNQGQQKQGTAG